MRYNDDLRDSVTVERYNVCLYYYYYIVSDISY